MDGFRPDVPILVIGTTNRIENHFGIDTDNELLEVITDTMNLILTQLPIKSQELIAIYQISNLVFVDNTEDNIIVGQL